MSETVKIRKLLETIDLLFENSLSSENIIHLCTKIMYNLEKKYKSSEIKAVKVPAAPNSMSFRAVSSGFIRAETNVHIPGGYYGFDRHYLVFMKIGTEVDLGVQKAIQQEFITEISKITDDYKIIKTTDNKRLFFDTVHGSSWGGFGYFMDKA